MASTDESSTMLLERAGELAQLDEAIAATAAGAPRAILIEGPAGIGKTALLATARRRAARAGLRVLAARGGELERELSLGIERQLFEPLLVRASAAERAALLARPAAAAAALFGLDGTEPAGMDAAVRRPDAHADEFGSQNALYWLCARLAERSPLMIAVDDLHWSDSTSLRWLGYLVRRLEELPLLLVLARRTDEPDAHERLLAAIAAESLVSAIRPALLTRSGVRALAASCFGAGPQDEFVWACHAAAGGNPLFTLQLLETARAKGLRPVNLDAAAVTELAPGRVSQFVRDRLGRLPPGAVSVAEQVALLGTRAEVRHVAALSGLAEDQVLTAADELAAAGLLRPGQPFEFIHPVVRSGVYESYPAARRAGDHGRAARLLSADGAAPAQVAVHLLRAPPVGDPWAVEMLRAAASEAVSPESRVTCLRRAVAEPTPAGVRAQLLGELGTAESLTFDAAAIEHLSQALQLSEDPGVRAMTAGQLAYCLVENDRAGEAELILRAAIARLRGAKPVMSGWEPLLALHVALLEADLLTSSITAARLREAVVMAGAGQSPAEADLLGMAAMAGPAAGATSAEVVALAERALRAADLSKADGVRLIHCPVWALETADHLDDADRWFLRIQEAAQRWESPTQFMLAASARALVCCRRGALADAEQDASAALDLARAHGRDYGMSISAAALVISLTEQDRLAAAEAVLADGREGHGAKCDLAVYVLARGWLRVAQGRAAEALEDFLAAGRLTRESGHDFPGFWPWRIGAATAQLTLGRRAEAADLALEQLEMVLPFGAPGPTGVALRTLGLAERGQARLDLLAAARAELERSPALLERGRAELEFGAALRRAGRLADARQPLRRALDLADRCGAAALARRAREELLAAGGRPRRTRLAGVEALTVGELRTARRAARGQTNREIAQELFVTVKAVEKHLANAYRKLGIQGRPGLAEALGEVGRQTVGSPP